MDRLRGISQIVIAVVVIVVSTAILLPIGYYLSTSIQSSKGRASAAATLREVDVVPLVETLGGGLCKYEVYVYGDQPIDLVVDEERDLTTIASRGLENAVVYTYAGRCPSYGYTVVYGIGRVAYRIFTWGSHKPVGASMGCTLRTSSRVSACTPTDYAEYTECGSERCGSAYKGTIYRTARGWRTVEYYVTAYCPTGTSTTSWTTTRPCEFVQNVYTACVCATS